MNLRSRINKIEKSSNEAYKMPTLCFTDVYEKRMSIGKPINFEGSIEECENLIKKKKLSVINIINDIPKPGYRLKEWCL